MNTPSFSIIIPVFNASETLLATVDSVLKQTEKDWELILVDDGSTDGSLSCMRALANRDERIRAVSQSNKGPSAARNLGAELAKGEYLAFLDADDFWAPTKLAAHREFHSANHGIDASYARIEFFEMTPRGSMNSRTISTVPAGALSLKQIIGENPVCTTSNLVILRGAFAQCGGFSENLTHAEDQEFVARYIDHGNVISGIDETLVQYRMMESGLSADLEAMFAGWRAVARTYASQVDLAAAEAIYCRYLTRRALRTGARPQVALGYMFEGLQLDAAAFLADRKRGLMTILGSFAGFIMPRPMRLRMFA